MRTALFTLYYREGAEVFARALIAKGWRIIASRETFDYLRKKGVRSTELSAYVGIREDYGFPPTLHPKVEAGLTGNARGRIGLVYATNYPSSVGNDIGGRALLALAAKGSRIPVMDAPDMRRVIAAMDRKGNVPARLRRELIEKAYFSFARHLGGFAGGSGRYAAVFGEQSGRLMNGENPYQQPAYIFSDKSGDPLSLGAARRLRGAAPCFTNMADADCLIQTIALAAESFKKTFHKVPYICVAAKHGNACGMAVSWRDPVEAVTKALFANPRAIWGGEVAVNFPVTGKAARALFSSVRRKKLFGAGYWMLDIILAPSFSAGAVRVLGTRERRKLLEIPALSAPRVNPAPRVFRFIRGGMLSQPPHDFILDLSGAARAGRESLIVAWAVAWSSNHGGNEIALARDGSLLAAGGGPSTYDAARTALSRAGSCGHDARDASFAANAFFPFTDAVQLLIDGKVCAGVVPGGGKCSREVRGLLRRNGVAMTYLHGRFRGFSRH